ncbi:MAG: hypothetical protein WCL50_18535, partial [Spirochaetota bacterium]
RPPQIEFIEMLEMVQDSERRSPAEIDAVYARMRRGWVFKKEPDVASVKKGIAWYLAIRDRAKARDWLGLSLIDVNGFKKLLGFPPSMIFTLLSEDPALCTVPENDSLGAVTQVMLRALTGEIAPYLEFYEFMEDRVLMGVPDYVPRSVVDGELSVLPSKFGDFGEGLLGVSKVRTGRVTLCRLTSSGDRYAMHLVTGEAVAPRSWEECGWAPPAPQLPSLEVILDGSVEDFAQKVMSQHYIVSYGDRVEEMTELCRLLGVAIV